MARYRPVHKSLSHGHPAAQPDVPHHSRRRPHRWPRWLAASSAVVLLAGGGAVALAALQSRSAPPGAPRPAPGEEHEEAAGTPVTPVAGELGPNGVTAAWVKAENAKPGTANWHLTDPANKSEIEGYADHVSITPGEAANLYVSTTAPTFHVETYRMGYYQGLGARLIWTSGEIAGTVQAKPTVDAVTNMVEARWQPSLAIPSNTTWPEGDYVMKLVASTGKQQYVPLTVRNDHSTSAYVMMNAVTTWEAYNQWGGYDLYQGPDGQFKHRSRVVSFDRPYGNGTGDFLGLEYPLVSLAESVGLDVTYVTNVDVNDHPELLQQHRAVFSLGHDEYYSMVMRQGLIDARDHGVNLAFMGANAIYRHIRFAPSALGPDRHVICYKSAREDPLNGHDNADVTVDWRDPPTNLPESSIICDYYQCNPVKADMVVAEADNWLFAGTGLQDGSHLSDVVASEYDRYDTSVPHPANVEVLARSPLTCGGKRDHSDATYYTALSGAGVFATGTNAWIGDLTAGCPKPGCAGPALIRMTQNLLALFGGGPAGVTHPSKSNTVGLPTPAGPAPPAYTPPAYTPPAPRTYATLPHRYTSVVRRR